MTEDINRCIDPQIYPGSESFGERRAVLLGSYIEKELDADLEGRIREHLDRCACCTEFVRDLQNIEELRTDSGSVIHASCPSSSDLDRFASQTLPKPQQDKIAAHLSECALCKEEMTWLQNLDDIPAVSNVSRTNWVQYGAIAAALFFMVLSFFLFTQRASISATEERLRAAAVIKEPNQIDYEALAVSSTPLSENMAGIYEKGIEALRRQSYQEAIRHLEIVMRAYPDHSGCTYLVGYSYFQMNHQQRAFELCDRAEKMSPHSLERCLTLVNIALKTGHFRRAIEEISGLHHAAPDHPEVKATYERITAITEGRTLRL